MPDARVDAIRADELIGKGTCTSIDECYSDDELFKELEAEGIMTPSGAVKWFRKSEGLWIENGLNQSSGEPDCPIVTMYDEWQEKVVKAEAEDKKECCSECGEPSTNIAGMCYECQCKAHALGWYDMETGYIRM